MMYGSWDMVCNRWTDVQIDEQKNWHIEVSLKLSKVGETKWKIPGKFLKICKLLVRVPGTANIYNKSSRTICEICSWWTKITSEPSQLMSLSCIYCQLWIYLRPCSSVSIAELEQVIICCRERLLLKHESNLPDTLQLESSVMSVTF